MTHWPAPAARGSEREVDVLATDVDRRSVVPRPERAVAEPGWPAHAARRRPEWLPLALAIVGWPLWWALGLSQLVFIAAAVPLAVALRRRRQPLRLPPGFLLWMLFLLLVLVSGLAIDVDAEGLVKSQGVGRYVAYSVRLANYLAVTVVLLYVCNTKEAVLSRARLIGWFAWLALWAIALGLIAIVVPDLQWTSPLSRVLPGFLRDGSTIQVAQVQAVLGDPTPRPAAPFTFTNSWGHNTALLLVWLVVAWGVLGSPRKRILLGLVLAVGAIPIVYSLNRGMWLGLLLALLIAAVRLAVRGRTAMIGVGTVLVGVGAIVFVLSPLQGLVQQRLDSGHSNDVRGWLAETAIDAAKQSPVIGFGSTRRTIGSDASIAIGPTPDCPRCGGRTVGSTGQATLLLVSQGFVGLGLYVGFLAASIWAHRGDHSPLGTAALVVIAMEIFFGLFYTGLTMPLAIVMCGIGMLFRNAQLRQAAVPA